MLQVDNVSFEHANAGGGFALHNISVDVAQGSVLGLLGPNGGGKTTLLRLMSGVLRPSAGVVRLDGEPITRMSRTHVAQRLAVVPQETHPTFDYTALEMVLMGRHPHLARWALEGPDDLRIAQEAMAATGTAHLSARPYMTLSGGEKQRVIIASALAQAPQLLLLDEPTASLDLGYQFEIAKLLTRLHAQGTTLVLASHDLNLAASVCDRMLLLREGRVLAYGATADVLTAPHVRALYGVEADVTWHPKAGHLTVVPLEHARP